MLYPKKNKYIRRDQLKTTVKVARVRKILFAKTLGDMKLKADLGNCPEACVTFNTASGDL